MNQGLVETEQLGLDDYPGRKHPDILSYIQLEPYQDYFCPGERRVLRST